MTKTRSSKSDPALFKAMKRDVPTLGAFIVDHMPAIVEEWQTYAASLSAMDGMDVESFRSEANAILHEIASQMRVAQSSLEQQDKSQGLDLRRFLPHSAAKQHGAARQKRGFTVVQLITEFRALRATVIRLWMAQLKSADLDTVCELTRFNEAVDQLMSDSITTYTQTYTQTPAPLPS